MPVRLALEHFRKSARQLFERPHKNPSLMQSMHLWTPNTFTFNGEFGGKYSGNCKNYLWREASRIQTADGPRYEVYDINVRVHHIFDVNHKYTRSEERLRESGTNRTLFTQAEAMNLLRQFEQEQTKSNRVFRDGNHTPYYFGRWMKTPTAQPV